MPILSHESGQFLVGVWEPSDQQGKSFGKKYRIFAAPQDLKDSSGRKILLNFEDAAILLTQTKDWHHHNGLRIPKRAIKNGYEAYLYGVLATKAYKGEWFIPPRELLNGTDRYGNRDSAVNLYDIKNTGAFVQKEHALITTASGSNLAHWYWSCTEHTENSAAVWGVDFTNKRDNHFDKNITGLNCRPCRVELVL